jgi:hypothetical protein
LNALDSSWSPFLQVLLISRIRTAGPRTASIFYNMNSFLSSYILLSLVLTVLSLKFLAFFPWSFFLYLCLSFSKSLSFHIFPKSLCFSYLLLLAIGYTWLSCLCLLFIMMGFLILLSFHPETGSKLFSSAWLRTKKTIMRLPTGDVTLSFKFPKGIKWMERGREVGGSNRITSK